MKTFMGKNFLLETEAAKVLFHNYADKLPIIDYHCHVSPKEIAEDKRYNNITELWLGGDHYKWRAMRCCGVPEEYITGNASDYDKFKAWCKAMPKLIGNPLYHWSHLELRRYFDCNLIINEENCDAIWETCNAKLAEPEMSVRNIIRNSNVKLVCTTDDPVDSLEWHKLLADDASFDVKVLPAFRPDKGININKSGIAEYMAKLSAAAGVEITDVDSLKKAYVQRLDLFASLGCKTADHGFDEYRTFIESNPYEVNEIFKKAIESDGKDITDEEMYKFKTEMLTFLAAEYKKRGFVMQIHFGVLRNQNTRMFKAIGPDTGFDTVGNFDMITPLSRLLDKMDSTDGLPRTILYSINPTDNAAVAALCGCFELSGDGKPKVIQGSAWWFSDNLDGMRRQMTDLANLSAFGNFLGMLTDSRSFISYTRHEYFRRILCDLIGKWVENGEYPADIETLAELVADICYNNAKNFFGFDI
ncbi:MAG: glucuronate isomerase [Clostridiales bacterium]|nr:glucuronate isomerase [Clostridiales bacterium]